MVLARRGRWGDLNHPDSTTFGCLRCSFINYEHGLESFKLTRCTMGCVVVYTSSPSLMNEKKGNSVKDNIYLIVVFVSNLQNSVKHLQERQIVFICST